MAETKKTKQQAREELPYERFIRYGPQSLTEAELLAIILRTGTKGEDTVSIGNRILELPDKRHKGLLGLHYLSLEDLMSIKGIGLVKAVRIKCITELSKRMSEQTAGETLQFTTPASVAAYYMEALRHAETERTLLVLLNGRNRLIEEVLLSQGTVNASLISTRDIFRHALRAQAVSMLLIHNHPSGSPQPSSDDITVTRRIREAALLMDIGFLDHIILGDNSYTSLRQEGLLT